MLFHPTGVPLAPSKCPEIIRFGESSIKMSWDVPLDDGGFSIIGYQIEKTERAGNYWVIVNEIPVTDTKYIIENLQENSTYRFRVRAINSVGLSDPSPSTPLILFKIKEGMLQYIDLFSKLDTTETIFITKFICVCVSIFHK